MNDLPLYPTPRQAAYVVPPPNSANGRAHPLNHSSSHSNSHHNQGHSGHSGNHGHRKKSAPQPSSNYKQGPGQYQNYSNGPPPQPVQQVHFPQNQSHPSQQYYQHPSQSYSSSAPLPPAPQPQYNYQQPNNLAAAPTPQAQYYSQQQQQQQQNYQHSSPAPPPPQPAPMHQQSYHPHSPVTAHAQQDYQLAPVQQRYDSNVIKKPPPPSTPGPNPLGQSSRMKSKESLHDNNGSSSKSASKQKLENELRAVFDKVDYNNSGKISKSELSNALLNFDHTKFQESTIVLMINLFSSSSNSKHLNFDQFVSLWKYLSAYKKLFVQADTNGSGDISFGEFQKILEQIGYKLNIDLVLHLFQRFSYKSFEQESSIGTLKFDKFIELLVYLRKLTDVFKKYDKDLSGVATINFSDFLFEVSNLN